MAENPAPVRPVALVTGASAGIGDAFARLLAASGHDLVVVARDRARLEALAKELVDRHHGDVEVLAADLTATEELRRVEARLGEPGRPVDVLVNNAGFGTFGEFHELDLDEEEREIRLNVLAVVRLTHAALGPMVARGKGGILNVSSLAGHQPAPFDATYGATKAFVTSFTEAVHEEVKGTGVHVTVLCPGLTRTEFQERAGVESRTYPDWMWQNSEEVARCGLDGLARNRAVAVPGPLNTVTGIVSELVPHAISRRVYRRLSERSR